MIRKVKKERWDVFQSRMKRNERRGKRMNEKIKIRKGRKIDGKKNGRGKKRKKENVEIKGKKIWEKKKERKKKIMCEMKEK